MIKNSQILAYENSNKHNCKNQGNLITDGENGEICCSKCGVVLVEKIINPTNGIVYFSDRDYFTKATSGPPSKIHIQQGGSIISKSNTDASGRSLQIKNKIQFSRMRLWESRNRTPKERNFSRAFVILDAFADKLNLSETAKEHAAYIYRKAVDMKIIRGHSIPSMIASAIYATCKQLAIPRSIDDIAQAGNIPRRTLSRSYRRLVQKLRLKIIPTKIDYISKVASSVSASEKSIRLSQKILDCAKKENIHVGKNPIGMTSAAVYLASIGLGENITMKKISEKNYISVVTIRKLVKALKPFAAKYIKTIEDAGKVNAN